MDDDMTICSDSILEMLTKFDAELSEMRRLRAESYRGAVMSERDAKFMQLRAKDFLTAEYIATKMRSS